MDTTAFKALKLMIGAIPEALRSTTMCGSAEQIAWLIAENERKDLVLADHQATIGGLMGAAAKAEVPTLALSLMGDERVAERRTGERLAEILAAYRNGEREFPSYAELRELCPAAPAAPAEQAEPIELVTRESALEALGHLDRSNSPGRDIEALRMLRPAPAAPLPALKNGFLYQEGLDIKAVLYTDAINDQQVCRDDLWLATTEALNKLAEGPAAPIQAAPLPELTGPSEARESIGDDRKFCRLARAWDVAEHEEGDNAVKTWESLVAYIDSRLAASPSPAPAQQQEPSAGLEAAAALIEKKVADYDREHGNTDPDTGTREYPGDGAQWIGQMEELAEEIRAQSSASAEPAAPGASTEDKQ